jgi:hypothetical protein
MGADTAGKSSGGGARTTPVQTYEQFKTPEGREAALQRQKKIKESTTTKTGAFANQEAELTKAGYKLSEDKSSVLTKDGKTVAGVTDSGQLFSGSKKVTDIIKKSQPKTFDQTKSMSKDERQLMREGTTYSVLNDLSTSSGGEVSKLKESQLQKSLNYGRGIQYSPTVLDPTRTVASTPTLKEFGGDIARAAFGGQAKQTIPGLSVAYQPMKTEGILQNLKTPGMIFIEALTDAMKPKKKTVETKIGSSLLGGETTGSTDSILGNSVIK